MFVFAPLTTYLFFSDLRFWKYTRYFFRGMMTFYRQLALIITNKRYRAMFSIPLIAPPMKQPDKVMIELAATWDSEDDECRGCSLCCLKMECALFDQKSGICMGYDSFYWRYFNCGRYPATQNQIDYYECPKWIIKPVEDREPGVATFYR
ncbi:MAG: hypothetical protein CVU90_01890 [Firmicutes bacterium HGW-Firmicutes-15]|nr:MAG: hypothetical protein CVU90_01890 [Firmicutes bacterium HGW-Firmicutes-15]